MCKIFALNVFGDLTQMAIFGQTRQIFVRNMSAGLSSQLTKWNLICWKWNGIWWSERRKNTLRNQTLAIYRVRHLSFAIGSSASKHTFRKSLIKLSEMVWRNAWNVKCSCRYVSNHGNNPEIDTADLCNLMRNHRSHVDNYCLVFIGLAAT